MDRGLSPAEQKLAEKLLILNERGKGMLTRIYNIKKACSDPRSRPAFLNEKALEPALKIIVKKFPAMENSKVAHMQPVLQIHTDIVKGLSNYYFTFVDVMIFKDHASELLTQIDASFVHFDITLNYELTTAYFQLVSTYASLFLLIARVEDRKAVLGLFNHAFEMQKGQGDGNFPRLGQMIVNYENPFKKLSEEFTPHAQRIGIALHSLNMLFTRRNISGEQMRQQQVLSLTSRPQQMLNPALSETVPCEYLSLEEMIRWMLICYTLCPSQLTAQSSAGDAWKLALQDGFCITLFRDEVLYIHKEIATLFDSIKTFSKKSKEVLDCLTQGMQTCISIHAERRNYLRNALSEMNYVFSDQPGLLGPKALIALLALSHARDEVQWLVRHKFHPPPKGRKINSDDFSDSLLPQLMHEIIELRELFTKYSQVIQRYFMQYLSGFDVAVLKTIIQGISVCPEDVSLIMTSFVEDLSALSVKQVDADTPVDLRGVRLDWMRLQAYTSIRGSVPELKEKRELAVLMNTVVLHTKLVDYQQDVINDVSDLSLLCFYPSFFEANFVACLDNTQQMRYSIAYPIICSHFLNCTHELCPEERQPIGERSLSAVNSFLDAIAYKATQFISQLCEEHLRLARQTNPGNAVNFMQLTDESRAKKDRPRPVPPKPGIESKRKTVENLKPIDSKYEAQIDLMLAITYVKDIPVWEHVFSPKEYLVTHIEEFFAKTIFRLLNYNEATHEIAKPSALLADIKAYMATLHRLEEFVNLDMGRIFNASLLQQTQNCDNTGGPTLTSQYTFWYNDILIKRMFMNGGIVYSPALGSFISQAKGYPKAEEYTDIREMRSLAELLGAYGVRHFSRKLVAKIIQEIEELKKLVLVNKDVLGVMLDNPMQVDHIEIIRRLRNFDDVITRTINMGLMLTFRKMLTQGLSEVLPRRAPYLMRVLSDFKDYNPRNESTLTHEMAQAGGIETEFDAELYHALRNNREKNEEEGSLWTLLLTMWAVAIPNLAFRDTTEYNPKLEAHENNAHCISIVINLISQALFTITGDNIEDKMKVFLQIAASSMLKLGLEPSEKSKEFIPRQRASAFILLDQIVQESPYISRDELEELFPYALVRDSYAQVLKKQRSHLPSSRTSANMEAETVG